MTGLPAPQAARNVPGLLLALRNAGFSGAVVVSGSPGGTIHLRDGLVTAAETPGAPTAESVLLRSRRVAEADWEGVRAAGGAGGDLGPAVLTHGLVGAAELEVVRASAVFDGAFAMALTPPGEWEVDDGADGPPLPAAPGIEPQRLADETARRLAVLTRRWGPPGEFARTPVRPSARAESGTVALLPRHQDILRAANNRRTPRDIAFMLGRGVFSVMLDLTRLDARGLIHRDAPRGDSSAASAVTPRRAASSAGSAAAPPPPDAAPAAPLPRRVPGGKPPGARATTADGAPPGSAQRGGAGAAAGILRRIRSDLLSSPGGVADEASGAKPHPDDDGLEAVE